MIEPKVTFPADSPPAEPATATAVAALQEAWKTVAGYDAEIAGYELTDTTGLVRRASTGKLLQQSINGGRPYVMLHTANTVEASKRKKVYVKTAVLLAYQPAYPPGTPIRHVNGDNTNCSLLNLAWMDDELRLWGTHVDGTAIFVQAEPYGRRRAWGTCTVGHQISTTGKPDRNTAMWGTGHRHCLACLRGEPKGDIGFGARSYGRPHTIPKRWQNAPQPHYDYTRSWGVATAPTARGRIRAAA
jgi:hypothetical protein